MLAIERLAKQMNWNKFSLLGHSMGAGVCNIKLQNVSLYND